MPTFSLSRDFPHDSYTMYTLLLDPSQHVPPPRQPHSQRQVWCSGSKVMTMAATVTVMVPNVTANAATAAMATGTININIDVTATTATAMPIEPVATDFEGSNILQVHFTEGRADDASFFLDG